MRVSDFDFELPEHCIASQPLAERDASRLLCLSPDSDVCADSLISELTKLVQPGDVWVLNDTRVIPARLIGHKPGGGKAEVLLLEPTAEAGIWHAWGKSNKPLKTGTIITFSEQFSATVISRNGKDIRVRLDADDIDAAIEAHGHMPLPPYIARPDTEADKERYQTVFARHSGAVAAPTAGLHLTHALMDAMRAAGATFVHLTLHVGPGTFQPVQVEHMKDHQMHEERYIVPDETAAVINSARLAGRRIVAVGTTALRTLEAAGQSGVLMAGSGRTSIFICPGYHFHIVDALLTNFHLPRSTLMMLVSALAGRDRLMAAYAHARENGYRFYSYGDAMFLTGCSPADSSDKEDSA